MSRSIHTTTRDVYEVWRSDYAGSERRAAELERLREETRKKWRIKETVKRQRRQVESPVVIATPELIPICIRDQSEYVHYPAAPADILGVLGRIPAGVLDGLSSIDLCLGEKEMAGRKQDDEEKSLRKAPEYDPFTSRRSYRSLSGVYSGKILGQYIPQSKVVLLFAYVYEPDLLQREMWELYLRLEALSTLIHEIGHHYDHIARIDARGKWRSDHKEKAEEYAEGLENSWVEAYVLPYLIEAYPGVVAGLEDWVQHYGGVRLSLSRMCSSDCIVEDGWIPFSIRNGLLGEDGAVENLAEKVYAGESLEECRLDFSWNLSDAGYFIEAHQSLDQVPPDYCTERRLLLRAKILISQKRTSEALEIINQVLKQGSKLWVPLHWLTIIFAGRHDWAELADTAAQLRGLVKQGGSIWMEACRDRARALFYLGDIEGFEAEVHALSATGDRKALTMVEDLRETQNGNDPWL